MVVSDVDASKLDLADGRVDVEGFVDFESGLTDVDRAFQRAMDPETVKDVLQLSLLRGHPTRFTTR